VFLELLVANSIAVSISSIQQPNELKKLNKLNERCSLGSLTLTLILCILLF